MLLPPDIIMTFKVLQCFTDIIILLFCLFVNIVSVVSAIARSDT